MTIMFEISRPFQVKPGRYRDSTMTRIWWLWGGGGLLWRSLRFPLGRSVRPLTSGTTETERTLNKMEPCEQFKCESGWLPIGGEKDVLWFDNGQPYDTALLIPTAFTACPCNPWYSLNLDLGRVGDYYAGYRAPERQVARTWLDERDDILTYLRQADIQAGKHLPPNHQGRPYSETAAIEEEGREIYRRSVKGTINEDF